MNHTLFYVFVISKGVVSRLARPWFSSAAGVWGIITLVKNVTPGLSTFYLWTIPGFAGGVRGSTLGQAADRCISQLSLSSGFKVMFSGARSGQIVVIFVACVIESDTICFNQLQLTNRWAG